MLTVSQVRDGDTIRYTVSNAEGTERFDSQLLAEADSSTLLDFDREAGIVTITAENGVWRYRVVGWDDDGWSDRTVVAHLLES
jgi:hypothetical protein